MWRSKRQASIWVHEEKKKHYNLVASCLPKLHSDPTFSIALFSPLGPRTGCGAVPRTLETPRHSPPLRSRPRDALFCIELSPGPFLFFKVLAILVGFWKLRNFLRPINASMKEAKARRRRRRKSRSREARAELYMPSAHSRIDRPLRLTSTPLILILILISKR